MRAMMSLPPPGGVGTRMRIGLEGYVSRSAEETGAAAATASRKAATHRMLMFATSVVCKKYRRMLARAAMAPRELDPRSGFRLPNDMILAAAVRRQIKKSRREQMRLEKARTRWM